ncbi:quercetin 2,3-dioxygenase [Nitrospira sp.]|nr:quercetin 2,3-dioxygenase [Nitrospira sp.]
MNLATEQDKAVLGVYRTGSHHMVGDGFPVRNLFPSNELDRELSPFLLLDYAGPFEFPPTPHPRGVGEHPHRGFETVTIMYQGILTHRDSAGNGGTIGPGDVQWMTAASGVVHEEMHEREFARRGGTLEAVQLWVNLPHALKMSAPRYQTLLNGDIPTVTLKGGAGRLRVIAGEYGGVKGPAQSHTPVHVYDLRLVADRPTELPLIPGFNSAVVLLQGEATINSTHVLHEAELALLAKTGERIVIEARRDSTLLILSGKPIDEPIARYGPFVMTTRAELVEAAQDYQAGKMGHLT